MIEHALRSVFMSFEVDDYLHGGCLVGIPASPNAEPVNWDENLSMRSLVLRNHPELTLADINGHRYPPVQVDMIF